MAILDYTRPPPELSGFYPIGRETTTRTGTRTLAGPTTAAEEAAAASAYAGIDPSTFGRVSDADMAALRSAYETSVFGRSDADVNAMAAEAGAAPTGAGNVAALRALTRSTAALPLAEIDYRNRAGGATAWGNLAMQRALERYRALTQGRTETLSDTTEGIKYGLPSASVQQAGGGGGGGGVGGGGGGGRGGLGDDFWSRPFDPFGGWKDIGGRRAAIDTESDAYMRLRGLGGSNIPGQGTGGGGGYGGIVPPGVPGDLRSGIGEEAGGKPAISAAQEYWANVARGSMRDRATEDRLNASGYRGFS